MHQFGSGYSVVSQSVTYTSIKRQVAVASGWTCHSTTASQTHKADKEAEPLQTISHFAGDLSIHCPDRNISL